MIERLKRRVFRSILLSAAGVLLAILLALNGLKLAQTAAKADSILDSGRMLMEPERGDVRGGRDRSELMRSVSRDELGAIRLQSDGSVVLLAGCAEQLEEETLAAVVEAAATDADGKGRAAGWRYKASAGPGGLEITILDAASLRRENWETALLSLGAFAAACCLFLLLARLLAKAIVRPVEENMQAQKRFISDASHELKTPLTVIDANASVLEQSVGQSKWLDYIKEQTGRMAGLVDELLQLSRLEEAADSGAPRRAEPYNAAEAILGAALPFESVAFERGISLETEVPEKLDAVGSAQELQQLAAILIDNAVKHCKAGGTVLVAAAVSHRHGRKEGPMLELRVSNPGEEIPPEALEHIFDRFYRADEARTRRGGGYGLGLAIAKGLAEKNGGSVAASSKDGLTEFTLRLPLGG